MSIRLKEHIYKLFINITVATWATVMFLFVPACGSKEKPTAAAVKEGDSLPDMRTTGVTTLVSDSGMIRYKIITAEWLIYSHRNPPFWAFEKGIYLEKFDSLFHVDASIKADTALLLRAQETMGATWKRPYSKPKRRQIRHGTNVLGSGQRENLF